MIRAARLLKTSARCMQTSSRLLSTDAAAVSKRPVNITASERAALRAARRERGRRALQQQQQGTIEGAAAEASASSSNSGSTMPSLLMSRWIWYLGVGVPTVLSGWGLQDENSPPARFASLIGLTDLVGGFAQEIAKPSHDKLLPDWSQVCLSSFLENIFVWSREKATRHANSPMLVDLHCLLPHHCFTLSPFYFHKNRCRTFHRIFPSPIHWF